ncbi:TOM1_1 [Sanghuangporus vaninii]
MGSIKDLEMEDIQWLRFCRWSSMNGERAPQAEDTQSKFHANLVINYVDAFGRFFECPFFEGLFQRLSHFRDFIQITDGLACFACLLSLSCLHYDHANSVHSDSIVQVVRTMVEVAPAETLDHLAKQVSASLDEMKEFWQAPNSESKLQPLVEIQDEEELSKANAFFHKLVTLHVCIMLLSGVCSTSGFNPSTSPEDDACDELSCAMMEKVSVGKYTGNLQ